MISLLLTYKYILLFPIAVVEGPIITIIAGLFVKLGIFNFYAAYAVVVVGDMFGDSAAYAIGRYGGPIILHKFSKFFHITEEKKEKAAAYFNNHRHKTLIISKIVQGVGVAGLVTAGHLKISYKRFFVICTSVSLLQSAVYLSIGILFGSAYMRINHYMNIFSIATIIIGAIIALAFVLYFRLKKV